jgi:hypothetical protein
MAYKDDITADYVRSILDYDPETGLLTWKRRERVSRQWNTKYAGKEAGVLSLGYIKIRIEKRAYQAHRLIWLMMTGSWPKEQIDHIDMDRSNNRWVNLREASNAENMRNTKAHIDNSSGFKGVYFVNDRNKFRGSVMINGKISHTKRCETAEEAYEERCALAKRLHGEYVRVS